MNIQAQLRSFSHALQFLTRLPAPRVDVFDPADLSRSAMWFPVVGVIVGAIVGAALWLGALSSPAVGALFALLALVPGCALAACVSLTTGRPARLQRVVSIPPAMSVISTSSSGA